MEPLKFYGFSTIRLQQKIEFSSVDLGKNEAEEGQQSCTEKKYFASDSPVAAQGGAQGEGHLCDFPQAALIRWLAHH